MTYVFISYSKKNRAYARKLADYLLERGFDVWIDDRIDFGTNWEREIFKAIDGCAAFVVIMTPELYESDWVQRERLHAEARKKPPLPLLLEGEVFPFYRPTQYSDVRPGRAPSQAFLKRLASFVPSNESTGQDLAEMPQRGSGKAYPRAAPPEESPEFTRFHAPEGWEEALRQRAATRPSARLQTRPSKHPPKQKAKRNPLRLGLLGAAAILLTAVITLTGLRVVVNAANSLRQNTAGQSLFPTSDPALTLRTGEMPGFVATQPPTSPAVPSATVPPETTPVATATETSLPPSATPNVASAYFPQSTNVRPGPGTEYTPPIGAFAQGQSTQILALNSRGDWYKVRYGSGEGWVASALVETSGDIASLPHEFGAR